MVNPYAMVPQALEQTRLTLRDIMSDYVSQKVQESKLKLAMGEMETERKAMELEGEKEQFHAKLGLARLAAEEKGRTERTRLESQRLADLSAHQKAVEDIQKKRLGIEEEKARMAGEEQKYLNEEKTPEEWAETAGLSATQRDIFLSYFPKDKSVKRREVQTAVGDLRKNPVMHFKYRLIGNIDRLEEMQDQLKDPNMPADQKTVLGQKYDTLYRKTNRLQQLVGSLDKGKTKLTAKDLTELKDEATVSWEGMSNEVKAQYKNDYKTFEKAFVDDYVDILKQGAVNLKELKREQAEKKAPAGKKLTTPLKAKDATWFKDSINEIEKKKGPDAAKRAFEGLKRYIVAGDIEEAKNFINIALGKAIGTRKKRTAAAAPEINIPEVNINLTP